MWDKVKSFFGSVSLPTVFGAVLVVVGAVFGFFAGGGASAVAFAVAMFGAGSAMADYYDKHSECNRGLTIAVVVLIGVGALAAGITGFFSDSDVADLVGYVTSAVALLSSAVCGFVNCKVSGSCDGDGEGEGES